MSDRRRGNRRTALIEILSQHVSWYDREEAPTAGPPPVPTESKPTAYLALEGELTWQPRFALGGKRQMYIAPDDLFEDDRHLVARKAEPCSGRARHRRQLREAGRRFKI